MDKYSIYNDIESRIKNCNRWTKTREGGLIVGIICQRIKDAMGLLRADKTLVYLPSESTNSRHVKQKSLTHQQIAIEWFRNEGHYFWCDILQLQPTWINHLIKTKGGVKL